MLKPFITYATFGLNEIGEIQGDVRITQVKVEYHSESWNDEVGMFVPDISLEDRIKVTLYPSAEGTKISFVKRTDNSGEGAHTRYLSVEQSTDEEGNDVWLLQDGSYGRDCDGGYSDHFDGVSDGSADPNYNNKWFPTMSDISVAREVGYEKRDYAAEAAGY